MLRPGDTAPEIDAVTNTGTRFRLSEQTGKLCTVVYFFPKAFTPGCTAETKLFRDNYPEIALARASIVGISTDDHDTQCRFASSLGAPFPMIGDKDKSIANAYGVLWPLVGLPMRVTFVINRLRTIEAVLHHEVMISHHRDDVMRIIDGMRRSKTRPPIGSSGKTAEPYELLEEAGVGGMGTVFRARERATNRIVAVKVLADPTEVTRFAREADLLSKLVHPNIVSYVTHDKTEDGRVYLVMEWLEGESLGSRLGRGKLEIGESVRIAREIATGLAVAHESGVVHRDIKPSNVFLTTADAVKILDFGVARRQENATTLTRTGQVVGTPAYMSPEQARGERKIDARSDIFALGSVLFRCLAHRPPFQGDNTFALLHSIIHDPTPRIEGIPAELEMLLAELLAKDPANRPASAEVVRTRLAAMSGGER